MASVILLPATSDEVIVRGDTIPFKVDNIKRNNTRINLTGATFKATGRHTQGESSDTPPIFVKTLGDGISDVSDDLADVSAIVVVIAPEDTASLKVSAPNFTKIVYVDVEMTESDGTISTIALGKITLSADMTRNVI